ncbi:SNF2-related protein [Arsenicicoccus cauae]|uniref:DEAD/DEAH box helicase n=1 Tax=Arsenicicoccus cauae TaxID=2663847 RepID=UPI00370D4034
MVQLVQATRLTDLDAVVLARLCGSGSVQRGQGYAQRDRVLDIVPSGDRRRLHGTVEGSRAKPYAAWAELRDHPGRPGHSTWTSSCTCPVGADCKHVVALILQAQVRDAEERAESGALDDSGGHWWRGMPPAHRAHWREALGAVAADDVPDRVALQLSVAQPSRGHAEWGTSIVLTPLVEGARGWIRTGISWTGLDPGALYGTVKADIDPLQEQALQEITRAVRARRTGSAYAAVERVTLGEVGPAAVRLMRDVEASGVALIDASGRPVQVAEESGRFELHLGREESERGPEVVMRARLALPDVLEGLDTDPIGLPAVGLHATTDEGLVIVGLDPPLTRVEESLLRESALRVPMEDWPSFVIEQLPALRRRVHVVLDPELETDASAHPRLLVEVTPHPGHLTEVALGWRYDVAGQHVDIHPVARELPMSSGGASRRARHAQRWSPRDPAARAAERLRDPEAEALVVGRLDAVLRPVLAGGLPPGTDWTHAHRVVLPPALTIALADALPALRDDPDVVVEQSSVLPEYVEARSAPVVSLGLDEVGGDDNEAGRGVGSDAPGSSRTGRTSTSAGGQGARSTDWFDLDVSVTVDEQDVPLRELIVALATGQEVLVLPSGTWLRLDDERLIALAAILREAADLQDGPDGPLRVNALHAGLWDELVELGVVERQSSRWQQTVDALLGLASGDRPVPEGLQATLRPYQLDGYQWLSLLWEARLGGILADDMGLGKTLQTLAMALRAKEQGDLADPLLIVAPTSVVGTWASEAARFTPGLRVTTVTSTLRKSGATLETVMGDADVVVTSYALVRLDEDAYLSRRWGGLVLDEAQFVKNHQAKTYQVVRRLDAGMKLAITGTPLENSLMDLWSLLSVAAPGLYPRPVDFRDTYVKPIEAGEGAELLATLRRRIRPLMMRRTKEQVARELPPKQEQVVTVPLHPRHRTIYDRHLQRERQRLLGLLDEDFSKHRIAILRALTAMRQLALHPALVDDAHAGVGESAKIDLLVEHLHELAAEGHRALVFSQFTGYLRLVRERLEREGIAHSYLDGRTRNRAERIEEFRTGTQPAFLISLKAGGFGLTLTEADYVYVLDPWWNPAAEAQAIDRTHRIGQDKHVNVYRLVSEDTIEDKVVALQQRKRELFAQVVDDGDAMSGAVTADDIRGLLG